MATMENDKIAQVVTATWVVESMSDVLVRRAAQTFVDSLDGQAPQITTSQLSNLVNMATSARTVYEIVVFVMYQMGRENKWRQKAGENSSLTFGEAILRELTGKDTSGNQQGKTIAVLLKKRANSNNAPEDLVVLFGARKYLGYLRQLHKFLSEGAIEERWDYVRGLAEQDSS